MDRRERYEHPEEPIRAAIQGERLDIWTALPGIIQSYDVTEDGGMTCSVQPAIQAQITSQVDGSKTWVNLPLLVDCPVYFSSGGGCTLTFPLAEGDECLVIFASRCIDAWWQNGGVQQQAEFRMHDLSDGFVFAGVRSKPRLLPNLSTSKVQLRSDDGLVYFDLHPTTHAITLVAPGDVDITAPTVAIHGNLTVSGTVVATGDVTGQGTSLHNHVHSGVQSGSSNTGAPV